MYTGLDLQRMRNARGLKASQLARLAGHHAVARMLSEAQVAASVAAHATGLVGASPTSAHARAEGSGRRGARRRQNWLATGEAAQAHEVQGGGGVSQEAVIGAIVQVRPPFVHIFMEWTCCGTTAILLQWC